MSRTLQRRLPAEGLPAGATTNDLLARWQIRGDRGARDRVFERFRPLARKLARRYHNAHEPIEDLFQVAYVGLLGAIDRFDSEQGSPFAGFAVPTILGELKRYFRNTGWSVHVPRGAQEMALRVSRASDELTARTGRAPRVPALAEYLEVTVEDVLIGLEAGSAHYSESLDAPARGKGADSEESQTLAESLGEDDERFGLIDGALSLAAAIPRLPYLERQALHLRVNRDMRQVDIARRLGCSQMQASRLLRRAMATLRDLTDETS